MINNIFSFRFLLTYFFYTLLIQESHSQSEAQLFNLGNFFFEQGQYLEAQQEYKNAKEAYTFQGRKKMVVLCDLKLAKTATRLGDAKKGLQICTQLETLHHEPIVVAEIQSAKGGALLYLGRNADALQSLLKAQNIFKTLGNPNTVIHADCYNDLGIAYWNNGNNDLALLYLQNALEIRKDIYHNTHLSVADSYNNIGLVNSKVDTYAANIFFNNALKTYQRLYGENHPKIALALNNIALQYDVQNQHDSALKNLEKAAQIWDVLYLEKHPNKAFTNFSIGNVYYHKQEYDKALDYEQLALDAYKELYGNKHPEVANIYNLAGSILLTQGRFEEAIVFFQKAIYANLSDQEYSSVGHPQLSNYYNADILLHSLLQKAKAFSKYHYNKTLKFKDLQTSLTTLELADELVNHMRQIRRNEKDKLTLGTTASEIYETGVILAYNMSQIAIKPKIYLEKAFEFAEKSKSAVLLSAIQDTHAKQYTGIPDELLHQENELKSNLALAEQQLASNTDLAKEADIKKTLLQLSNSYHAFIKKLEASYPNYYNLKFNVSHSSVADLQNVLNEHTALLTHFITSNRIYTFYVSKNKFRVFDAVKEEKLEKHILALRNSIKYGVKEAFVSSATLLYDQLMNCKIESNINQLAIIPQGRFATVPFEVLLKRSKGIATMSYQQMPYLVKTYKISYDNSATLYLQRSKAMKNYHEESEDILLIAPITFQNYKYEGIANSLNDLPSTEEEIMKIDSLFKSVDKSPNILMRKEANKPSLLGNKLKHYKYLHFATHGMVNESKPSLSRIFLSPKNGQEGSLFSSEIYNMNINANLVCLSACETGLGKLSKGEGIVGLSRALLYAGAENMIVSLWTVSDQSTSKIMVDFYSQHLTSSNHNTFSAALRKAKLNLLNEEQYSYPYYWAALILIGQ